MKNITWILVLILLILIGGGYYLGKEKTTTEPKPTPVVEKEIEGNVDDLVSFSVKPGDTVSGVLNFEGSVRNAYFFEANIGINILDGNKNVLKRGNAMATSEWMTTEPVSFAGTIDLTDLPPGPGYIQIQNDNPSDMRENDKFIFIPIIIGS